MPRFAVLPNHEYKACKLLRNFNLPPLTHPRYQVVPFTRIFQKEPESIPHLSLQAHIVSLTKNTVTLDKTFPQYGITSTTIKFDYAVYALGSHLPAPLDLWGTLANPDNKDGVRYYGEKSQGISWLKAKQELIKAASTVLVVGGGALGIRERILSFF